MVNNAYKITSRNVSGPFKKVSGVGDLEGRLDFSTHIHVYTGNYKLVPI